MGMIKDLLQLKQFYFYFTITLLFIAIGLLQHDEIYKVVLSNTEPSALNDVKNLFDKTLWLSLLITPVVILLRVTYTSSCLMLGRFLSKNTDNLRFSPYFNIALKGEIVWIAFAILNYILFTASLEKVMPFATEYLSLVVFLNIDSTEPLLLVLCSSISIMELLYILLMSALYSVSMNSKYIASFYFVGKTYGLGLLFYIVVLMFVTMFIMPH